MIKIIISPAKKMNIVEEYDLPLTTPVFLERAAQLRAALKEKSFEELQKLWQCNEKIARQNVERLQILDLSNHLTPALLSYEGIQYQYMAPHIFSDSQWEYVTEHLRILSGFYGILRPTDGVIPYRLEMQAKLAMGNSRHLYDYWGDALARSLTGQQDSDATVLNLASAEYHKAVLPHLPPSVHTVTCTFGELIDGQVKVKGTQAKMARGEMVRFMAEFHVTKIEEIKSFDRLGFRYDPDLSSETLYTYVRVKEDGDK